MPDLLSETHDHIATITLNRPEKLNAFSDAMLIDMANLLQELATDDAVRVIVVTGVGRAFSSGGDLDDFEKVASTTPAEIKDEVHIVQRVTRALVEHPKPIIAAINGVAIGGGLDMALACDIRFASETARVAETYIRMGLLPGVGGAYLLPRIVGYGKAIELLLSAEFLDAREAERFGILNKVFPQEDLMPRTYEFAQKIAKSAPMSVQTIKRLVRMSLGQDVQVALELAAANLPILRRSADHTEAVAAFKANREPTFHNK